VDAGKRASAAAISITIAADFPLKIDNPMGIYVGKGFQLTDTRSRKS
jgi:hypothetical protein